MESVHAEWAKPDGESVSTPANPLQGINPGNPLGWPGATGTNSPTSGLFGTPTNPVALPPGPTGTPGSQNPYGQGSRGGGDLTYNLAQTNLQSGLYKNALAPLFAQMMMGSGGDASNFFKTLMNLGSPYYQQQQRASLESGVNQAQNAAAGSRDALAARGYGYAPSGLEAASLGQQATGQAQNLSQLFLQNLFNNEQMQMGGAQGLAQLAGLFNPAQLLSGVNPNIQQPTNTAAETMSGLGSLVGGIFGSKGIPTGQG